MRRRIFFPGLAAAIAGWPAGPRPLPNVAILFTDGKRIVPRTAYRGKVMIVALLSTT